MPITIKEIEDAPQYQAFVAPFFNTGLRDFDRGPHDPMKKGYIHGW